MSTVFARLVQIEVFLEDGAADRALQDLTWLTDDISGWMDHYEAQLREHDIKLPYAPRRLRIAPSSLDPADGTD
jgi:hypothetical protein